MKNKKKIFLWTLIPFFVFCMSILSSSVSHFSQSITLQTPADEETTAGARGNAESGKFKTDEILCFTGDEGDESEYFSVKDKEAEEMPLTATNEERLYAVEAPA